jgi:hypothetical protein
MVGNHALSFPSVNGSSPGPHSEMTGAMNDVTRRGEDSRVGSS